MHIKKLLFLFLIGFLTSCQGGSIVEAGNPPQRVIKASLAAATETPCVADTVQFLDTGDTLTTTTVDTTDCSFEKSLVTGKLWSLAFLLDGDTVATSEFEAGADLDPTPFYYHTDEPGDLDLGFVTFLGGIATSENNPFDLVDRDNDTTSDYDDTDDDNDSILDIDEADCDADGIADDDDLDSVC